MHLPVVLALATGVRHGELMALRWDDIDLDGAALTVCRSLETTNEGLAFRQPKTAKGRRRVALPRFAVEALIQHKAKQAQHKLLIGPAYRDEGLVFAQPDGQPMHPDSITTMFRRLAQKAGLPGLRFHDLRHTHATQLLVQGIHPKVVSERLGHATISITLDTDSHVMPGRQEEAARRIAAAFGGTGS